MKELDLFTLLSVFNEMLGPMLWVLLAVAVSGVVAFVALLVWERGVAARRMLRSQAFGVLGGILALVFMVQVSSSGFTDAGGPADWFLIFLVFGLGLIGSAILVYTAWGWWSVLRRPAPAALST